MSLDMFGHIGDVFESIPANRIAKTGGAYVNGIWTDGTETSTPHTVTIQQASDKEIAVLSSGSERVLDIRRVYVNDGVLASISQADDWVFDGLRWKTVKLDNRPWRNYCKAIVSLYDEQT